MLKILIADDEKYERESIIELIKENFKESLQVFEAKNGREAIEVTENYRVEIVIMDIKMPGINGIKAIEEIRKIAKDTYFIMLTAYDYFDFAKEAVNLNVREYMLKPFSRLELIQKIDNAIITVKKQKEKRKSEIENVEKINNLIAILENELSYNIINNTLETIDYEMYLNHLKLDFNNGFSIVVKINEIKDLANTKKHRVGEFINEYLKFKYKSIGTYKFTEELVYFVQLDKNYDNEEEIKVVILNNIKKEVQRVFNLSVKVGVGKIYEGLVAMNNSYREALEVINRSNNIVNSISRKDIVKAKNLENSSKKYLFNKVEEYIAENIKEELDLDKISGVFNLSQYYFSRSFKEILGCGLTDYINTVRINKAKELLKKGEFTVKEVCFEVGYSDPNYFSKVFKKYEGITPTEYKYQ